MIIFRQNYLFATYIYIYIYIYIHTYIYIYIYIYIYFIKKLFFIKIISYLLKNIKYTEIYKMIILFSLLS